MVFLLLGGVLVVLLCLVVVGLLCALVCLVGCMFGSGCLIVLVMWLYLLQFSVRLFVLGFCFDVAGDLFVIVGGFLVVYVCVFILFCCDAVLWCDFVLCLCAYSLVVAFTCLSCWAVCGWLDGFSWLVFGLTFLFFWFAFAVLVVTAGCCCLVSVWLRFVCFFCEVFVWLFTGRLRWCCCC